VGLDRIKAHRESQDRVFDNDIENLFFILV
jgi:hypothetical protein